MNAPADSQNVPIWQPWPKTGERGGHELGSHDVAVWCIEAEPDDARLPSWWNLLDPAEKARADALRLPAARAGFIAAHATLRTVLAELLQRPAAALVFETNPWGRPALAADEPLHFSISRSAGTALIAVASVPEIGVDLETIQPLPDLTALASQYFAPDEIERLLAVHETTEAFYRCWTRKEAFVKATGLGLRLPLDSFSVSMDAEARLLRHPAGDREAAQWRLLDCQPNATFAAALAIRLRSPEVRYFRLP